VKVCGLQGDAAGSADDNTSKEFDSAGVEEDDLVDADTLARTLAVGASAKSKARKRA